MTAMLSDRLKKLRLSGLAQSLEVRLQEARANRLEYDEFLELVLEDELAVRRDRLIQRRTQSASFREMKTLEDFQWDFNRSVKKKQIFDLATSYAMPVEFCSAARQEPAKAIYARGSVWR